MPESIGPGLTALTRIPRGEQLTGEAPCHGANCRRRSSVWRVSLEYVCWSAPRRAAISQQPERRFSHGRRPPDRHPSGGERRSWGRCATCDHRGLHRGPFTPLPIPTEGLRVTTLYDEHRVLLVPASHHLAAEESIGPHELSEPLPALGPTVLVRRPGRGRRAM